MKRKLLLYLIIIAAFSNSNVAAKELFTFEGSINPQTGEFKLDIDLSDKSTIKASGLKVDDDYRLALDLEHFQLPYFEISSQIESSITIDPNSTELIPNLFGKISSQYSLIDYKPTKELSGHFEIKDGRVYFNSLSFADIAWNGFIGIRSPYDIDLAFEIDSIPMVDFLDFWARNNTYSSSGSVTGEIRLKGKLNDLNLSGNLQAYNGNIGKLRFDSIQLHASGPYPVINVFNTAISKTNGFSFMVDGPVDISDKVNFKKQVKALNVSPIVSDTATKTEWTIKRLKSKDLGSTEFKYLLRKGDDVHSSAEESAMLGVEQTLEF